MPATRAVAKAMADAGQIEVTQKGIVVDITCARGPIRLRLHTNAAQDDK